MEYKKYAPIIGQELTWPILKKLVAEIRREMREEILKKKPRKKRVHTRKETEDDGA